MRDESCAGSASEPSNTAANETSFMPDTGASRSDSSEKYCIMRELGTVYCTTPTAQEVASWMASAPPPRRTEKTAGVSQSLARGTALIQTGESPYA